MTNIRIYYFVRFKRNGALTISALKISFICLSDNGAKWNIRPQLRCVISFYRNKFCIHQWLYAVFFNSTLSMIKAPHLEGNYLIEFIQSAANAISCIQLNCASRFWYIQDFRYTTPCILRIYYLGFAASSNVDLLFQTNLKVFVFALHFTSSIHWFCCVRAIQPKLIDMAKIEHTHTLSCAHYWRCKLQTKQIPVFNSNCIITYLYYVTATALRIVQLRAKNQLKLWICL